MDKSFESLLLEKLTDLKTQLNNIEKNTQENNKEIVRLQTQYRQIEKDLNGLGSKINRKIDQYEEEFKVINETLNKANLKKMAQDVDKHDTALDTLLGSIKNMKWALGLSISFMSILLTLFKVFS